MFLDNFLKFREAEKVSNQTRYEHYVEDSEIAVWKGYLLGSASGELRAEIGRFKSKIDRSVARPVTLYNSEC